MHGAVRGAVWIVPGMNVDVAWLEKNVPRDAPLLPLDVNVLAACQRKFSQLWTIEELVAPSEIRVLADRADAANMAFTGAACGGEKWEGYDLPAMCWQSQEYFFRDTLLAECLGAALRAKGADRLVWVGARGNRAAHYGPTNDVVMAVLEGLFGDGFTTIQPSTGRGKAERKAFADLRATALSHLKREFVRATPSRKLDAVGIFPREEWERGTEPLAELGKLYGKGFELWTLGKPTPKLEQWSKQQQIHTLWLHYPRRVQREVAEFFARHCELWERQGRKEFAAKWDLDFLCDAKLDFHFEYFFKTLWVHLAEWLDDVERYLIRCQPRWVIASSHYVDVYALPHYAAHKLGIPSIALPHTSVPEGAKPLRAPFFAARNRLEAETHHCGEVGYPTALLCRNGANTLSYAATIKGGGQSSKRRVAMLVADEDIEDTLMAKMDRHKFVESFKALMLPPRALADLEFVYKAHPRYDLSPLLRKLLPRETTNVTILDPFTSLTDLLNESWMVVLCNYFGSASLTAVASSKPVIFLDAADHYWHGVSRLPFAGGQVVNSVGEFWRTLETLQQSLEQYVALTEKGKRFADEWLRVPTVTLGELLASDLHGAAAPVLASGQPA